MHLPEGWKTGHVKDLLAGLNSGVSVNGEDTHANKSEIGVLKVSAVSYGVFLPYENKRVIKEELNLVKEPPRKGSILISRSNTEALVGASVYIHKDYPNLFLPDKLWQTIPRKGKNVDLKWLFYFLSSEPTRYRLSKLATGTSGSMKNITKDELLTLPIKIPPFTEQQKIAQILSTWDKAIEKLETLIAAKQKRKKALMQQLLTGKKRFAGFDEPWLEVSMGEVFKRVTRKNTEVNTNVVTISAQKGLIKQDEFFNKSIASEILDNYFLLKNGEFAYNKSYSNGYPMGAVKRLNNYDKAVVTTLYICFAIKDKSISCSNFFEQYFESGRLVHGLMKVANEGGRAHGLLNVTPKDFFNLKLFIPKLPEQQKIASVLTAADTEIQSHQKHLSALKEQKKGLMQQLLTGKKRVKVDDHV